MEELELVTNSKKGDIGSFNKLVLLHQKEVYNFCLRLTNDIHMSEDLTQDTFISAWTGIKGLRGDNFKYWLMRIARNTCYDYFRSMRKKATISLEHDSYIEPSTSAGPEQNFLKNELEEDISRGLLELSADMREVVILSDIMSYNYSEISQIIKCPVGTVRSRLSRGRSQLRQYLVEKGTYLNQDSSV